jgi:hypothetical protein
VLRRFVAASMIGSIAIAIGALVILLIPGFQFNRTYPMIVLWCFVPCIWGLWAMVAPTHWVPDQLPYWGAALGLVAATVAIFSLNLPARFFGIELPFVLKVCVVMLGVLVYYAMWSLVKVAYHHLHHEPK